MLVPIAVCDNYQRNFTSMLVANGYGRRQPGPGGRVQGAQQLHHRVLQAWPPASLCRGRNSEPLCRLQYDGIGIRISEFSLMIC